MKIRVMSFDGTVKDFDPTPEGLAQARGLFQAKKNIAEKAKMPADILNEVVPFAHIHKCYHDESPTRPCEIIENVEKVKP